METESFCDEEMPKPLMASFGMTWGLTTATAVGRSLRMIFNFLLRKNRLFVREQLLLEDATKALEDLDVGEMTALYPLIDRMVRTGKSEALVGVRDRIRNVLCTLQPQPLTVNHTTYFNSGSAATIINN